VIPPVIVWFRRNLRLADNLALRAAVATSRPILPVYVHDENEAGRASNWWLHHSLERLAHDLKARGAPLLFLQGSAAAELPRLAVCSGAELLYFAREYSARARAEEKAIGDFAGFELRMFDDYYLYAPGTVLTSGKAPFRVFTPFWKACRNLDEPARPLPAPDEVRACDDGLLRKIRRELPVRTLAEFDLLPKSPDWAGGLRETWRPGETGGLGRLDGFIDDIGHYAEERDRPDLDYTSRLSPHLHFGEVSARQVWHAVNDAAQAAGASRGAAAFLRQLFWREFSGHLLYLYPEMPAVPLKGEFERFPWLMDDEHLRAWQRGCTGYPIVDAGMRELWATGWMHNRVRLIVASFLVKNLLIPWQQGARWFLDTLVDADLANNSASWQWVAGCGTDAAPYFRIFNPTLQGRKFDPKGRYIRRWVPEIASLSDDELYEPWRADGLTKKLANVSPGDDYPLPIVDLARSRERALVAYQQMRNSMRASA
jgi:deoxyribodipyrimidine photo-lyase